MADITKNDVNDWRSWSSGPTANDRGTVGFNRTYSSTGTTDIFISSIKFDTSASITTSSHTTYIRGTVGYLGNGQISVSDSCSVSFNTLGFSSGVGGESNQVIYVGAGSTFTASILAPSTGAITSLRKSGPGTLINTRVYPGTNYIGTWAIGEGTYVTAGGTNPLGTGTLELGGGATLRFNAGPTISNSAVQIFGGGFTFDLNGFSPAITVAVSAGSAGGAATVIGSGGTLTLNGGISCPLTITSPAAVTLGASANVTSATLSGTGTLNMNSGVLSSTAPSFTGNVTGTFFYSVSTGNKEFAGKINGSVTVNSSVVGNTLTITGAGTGYAAAVNAANLVLSGVGSLTTAGQSCIVTGNGTTTGSAGVVIDGSSVVFNQYLPLRSGGTVTLQNGGLLRYDIATDQATNSLDMGIYAQGVGNKVLSPTDSTLIGANGNGGYFFFDVASGGSLEINCKLRSYSGATRKFQKRGAGKLVWTGTWVTAATKTEIRVAAGTLHLNRTSDMDVGNGIFVDGGTLACSSTGRYAAQITGNVTFAAGTTFKFGTPA